MDLNQINGIIRAVVPAILAYVVGKGYLTEGTAADITAAVIAIAAAGWSIYTNKPSSVLASAAANPQVEKVIVSDSALASSIPSTKVVAK